LQSAAQAIVLEQQLSALQSALAIIANNLDNSVASSAKECGSKHQAGNKICQHSIHVPQKQQQLLKAKI
jgi:hypothetical protein